MNDIRSECRLCRVAGGGHSHRCVARPVMAERADYGPPDDSYCQNRFDAAIRRNWPKDKLAEAERRVRASLNPPADREWCDSTGSAVLAGFVRDVARQVDEITGVGKALDQASGQAQPVGGKLKGDNYYRVSVSDPMEPGVAPYVAECADIIEALGMTFNEGEAFKALWRLAAARASEGELQAAVNDLAVFWR